MGIERAYGAPCESNLLWVSEHRVPREIASKPSLERGADSDRY